LELLLLLPVEYGVLLAQLVHLKAALCSLSYLLDNPPVPLANLGIPLRDLSKVLLVRGILGVGAIVRFEVDHLLKRGDPLLEGLEGKRHDLDLVMLVHVLLMLDHLSLRMELMVLEVVCEVSEVLIAQVSVLAQSRPREEAGDGVKDMDGDG
jgi:hypothetical protein